MSEQNPYKKTDERIVYQNPFMTVMEHKIIHPDGQPGVYSFLSLPGAVIIVPVDDNNQIYLVKLWRYPIQQFSWEVPMGGLLDKNEPPLAAAKRELLEESGLVATQWNELLKTHPYSSSSNEVVTVFMARGLSQGQFTDTNEITECKPFPIDTVLSMIEDGQITNGEAITGIMLAERFLEKNRSSNR